MTRMAGSYVVQTGCCGALYRRQAYASINFSAHEYWTDGRRVNSLFPNDGGLRKCQCGSFFLLHDCDKLYDLPKDNLKPRAPKGWQHTKDNWWRRLLGKPSLGDYLSNYDIRTEEEITAQEQAKPPWPLAIQESDLPTAIETAAGHVQLEIAARRLWWMSQNDPFREVYRKHKEIHPDTFPPFEASDEQKENMLKLAYLLEDQYSPPWLEVAEICREVGDMDAAAKALTLAGKSDETLSLVIGGLIAMNYAGPARFRY